jgi:putative glycosyltransferase (TIGR04372 family)
MMQLINVAFTSNARPTRVLGLLLHRTLGDFIDQLLFVASAKESLSASELTVYFRPDRAYKSAIVELCPQVDKTITSMDGYPLDALDGAASAPIKAPSEASGTIHPTQDIILTPHNASLKNFGNLPRVAKFAMPNASNWNNQLATRIEKGWFATIHYREPNYPHRSHPQPDRDILDIDQHVAPVIEQILARGGQVVRIGHPEMTPLRKRDGYVDLCAAQFLEQAAAVSRSRFFFEISPSGPSSLAAAFGTPLIRCNANLICQVIQGRGLVLLQHAVDKNGNDVTVDAIANGFYDVQPSLRSSKYPNIKLQRNTPEQLVEAVNQMVKITSGDGWRDTTTTSQSTEPVSLAMPLKGKLNVAVLI